MYRDHVLLGLALAVACNAREPDSRRVEGRSFTAELGADGLTASMGERSLRLRFAGWGREGAVEPLVLVVPDERLELHHPGITEWWRETDHGVRQGWELDAPPPGSGLLVLAIESQGHGAWIVEPEGRGAHAPPWRYAGLAAWDAEGTPLEARLQAERDGLRILVDDTDAAYPVSIDPELTATTLLWPSDYQRAGVEVNYFFGWSVSSAGDIDDDGYGDIIVGCPGSYWFDPYGYKLGAAYVYRGGPAGPDSATEVKLVGTTPHEQERFGVSVSDAGDTNGDGYDDVIVGSRGHHGVDDGDYDFSNGQGSGAAFVFHGGPDGIEASTETGSDGILSSAAVYLFSSDGAEGDYFGQSVSGAGDVNGDGYDDVIVGAYLRDGAAENTGAAYLFLGSASGIDVDSEIRIVPAECVDADDQCGWEVSGAGDVDGDGYDDIVIGAPSLDAEAVDQGAAWVYLGSATGIDLASEARIAASDASEGDKLGCSVSSAGDVNADGYDDLIIGARGETESGRAGYVCLGGSDGIETSCSIELSMPNLESEDGYDRVSVSGAGDLDSDGYDDMIIGIPEDDASYLFFGEGDADIAPSSHRLVLEEKLWGAYLPGYAVTSAGDVNGDDVPDLLVGDPKGWNQKYWYYEPGLAHYYDGSSIEETWDLDSDADGLSTREEREHGTSDLDADCDDDGYGDGEEIEAGTDPNDSASHPGIVEDSAEEPSEDSGGEDSGKEPNEDSGQADDGAHRCGCSIPPRSTGPSLLGLLALISLLCTGRRRPWPHRFSGPPRSELD